MNATLKEMVDFLDIDQFIKITNTDEFPQLSSETTNILAHYGLPSIAEGTYPNIVSTGTLHLLKPHLIEIGVLKFEELGIKYCIDLDNNQRIIRFNTNTNSVGTVNSSLGRFIACKYTMAYYYKYIEFAKKYGEYYENDNYVKYAKILREMLNKVEPGIENYSTWEEEIFQKELGVI